MKSTIVATALLATLLFMSVASCKKDTTETEQAQEPPMSRTNKETLLSSKKWKISSSQKEHQGIVTITYGDLRACEADNLYSFKSDYYYIVEAGKSFCQGESLYELDWMDWELVDNDSRIKLSRFDRTPEFLTIVKINGNTLVLKKEKDGVIYQTTYKPEFE